MKSNLEGLTIETYGHAVKLTNGAGTVQTKSSPTAADTAARLADLQGYYPNRAQLQACARISEAARKSAEKVEIDL